MTNTEKIIHFRFGIIPTKEDIDQIIKALEMDRIEQEDFQRGTYKIPHIVWIVEKYSQRHFVDILKSRKEEDVFWKAIFTVLAFKHTRPRLGLAADIASDLGVDRTCAYHYPSDRYKKDKRFYELIKTIEENERFY